jgi:hypothetical protein
MMYVAIGLAIGLVFALGFLGWMLCRGAKMPFPEQPYEETIPVIVWETDAAKVREVSSTGDVVEKTTQ